ncbi:MAG TPA: HAD family hydrolase [Stellaceae bacterium]|jgi:D-glycero-D-manno-heptose 1,7-bisphosphate phosphatase|nr:HAD family hydrolase [Stellaceae bacterium]
MSEAAQRGLLLDRDGVINHDTGYVGRIADCRFVDGIFTLTREFAARGFTIVIVTNQSGIGRGYYSEADFAELMGWMRGEFARQGVEIAAVYHCPDHPTEGLGAYRRDNPWRKPAPGMFLQAAADLSLDMAGSWTIGDKPSDIVAGRAAGIGTLVLLDPTSAAARQDGDLWVVPDLAAVTELLHSTAPG